MKKIICAILTLSLLLCAGCMPAEPESHDAYLDEYAQANNIDLDMLMCSQLILVCADGSSARVDCFERSQSGGFEPVAGLGELQAYISADGLTASKTDDDACTPAGLHILGATFGCDPDPGTALDYTLVTENNCWITDPDSPDYNTWVETDDQTILDSAQVFSRDSEKYACCVTVEYNTDPVVRGKGRAVFFHCGDAPTDGGIALDTENMKNIVRWLTPDGLACVLICEK